MITITDLLIRFGEAELAQLTDRERYQDIDAAVVNKAISDAEGDAEGYLNPTGLFRRNSAGELVYIKSAEVPDMLVGKVCDIARWYLHEDQMLPVVEKRYDGAIAWLKLAMKNPAMITGVSQSEESSNSTSGVYVMPSPVPTIWDE